MAGYGEAIVGFARSRFIILFGYVPDSAWLAPLAGAVSFLLIGALLVLASRLLPVIARTRVTVTLLAGIAALGLFVGLRLGISDWAAALLAAGIAIAAGRLARKYHGGFRTMVRRTTPAFALLALLIGVAMTGTAFVRERVSVARLPMARDGAPNLLLLILDTVRAQNLSLYGYMRPTSPFLEAFAGRGIVFDQAIATSPWTLPSHASMFTGLGPGELNADFNVPFDDAAPTMAELLAGQGYLTAGFVANQGFGAATFGLDRGFDHYEDHPLGAELFVKSFWLAHALSQRIGMALGHFGELARKNAAHVNGNFLSWLDGAPDRPFFAFLNYYDAHSPFEVDEPFATRFSDRPPRGWLAWRKLRYPDVEMAEITTSYDAVLAYVDHQIGALLDSLSARGRLDNTLVIVASDHGEHLGEHGLVFHGNSLYLPLLHVPLLISFPGHVPQGLRIAETVSLLDLASTALDLLGAVPAELPGNSLRRFWTSTSGGEGSDSGAGEGGGVGAGDPGVPGVAGTSAVIAESEVTQNRIFTRPGDPSREGAMTSLYSGGVHYIRHAAGGEELYDARRDPGELRDLMRTPAADSLLARFRSMTK